MTHPFSALAFLGLSLFPFVAPSLFAQPAAGTPASPLEGVFGGAIMHQWVQPEYPESARQAKLEGKVVVEFVVELDGQVSRARVKQSTDERFNASALAAVSHWTFGPALADGRPVASGMQVPVVFELAQLQQKKAPRQPPERFWPVALPVTPPKLLASPSPDYPVELAERQLPGPVVFEFTVEADGTASSPKVLWTPHAAFVGEALRTLEKYRFEPAHQGPLPQKSGVTRGQMEFESLGVNRAGVLAANHISVIEPERYREPPRPNVLPEPVYPRDRLVAGETGSATVEFTVTERGDTTEVALRNASRPEFGAALLAAVETWKFDAALFTDQPASARLVATHEFTLPAGGTEHRLMLALKPEGAGIGGAGGLDQRLRPIWRIPPVYPQSLLTEKPAGQAVIEFIIDREGRARLPRVMSASREELGWAAAAAISQWVFAPPLRGGQPVDVKASIPFEFAPPKD